MRRRKPREEDVVNEIAHRLVNALTGERTPEGKNPLGVAFGLLGASKGGKARAKKLSAKKRKAIAKKAAAARWAKRKVGPPASGARRHTPPGIGHRVSERRAYAQHRMSDHRHTVLIVDHDAMMRDALATLIEHRGYNAMAVASGREALNVLTGGLRPCAILLDLVMPEMDGFAFRRAQLADPRLAAIPVLVVSGGGYVNEAKARKVGMRVFFRKPMDLDAFVRALHEHCGFGKAA